MFDLKPYLVKIPLFSDVPLSKIKIQQLGGLTNQNYLLSIDDSQYVLRVPRVSTNPNVNRTNEAYNKRITQELGISPKVLWREQDENTQLTGVCLNTYLKNTSSLKATGELSLYNSKILKEIANLLRVLQSSKRQFKGKIDTTETIKYLEYYFGLCTNEQQTILRNDFQEALKLLQEIKSSTDFVYPLVPSHIDLVFENILVDSGKTTPRIWLIDWEYSVMASPFWDVAMLSNEGKFNDEKASHFLKMVLTTVSEKDVIRLMQYRYIVKTVSACWHAAFCL